MECMVFCWGKKLLGLDPILRFRLQIKKKCSKNPLPIVRTDDDRANREKFLCFIECLIMYVSSNGHYHQNTEHVRTLHVQHGTYFPTLCSVTAHGTWEREDYNVVACWRRERFGKLSDKSSVIEHPFIIFGNGFSILRRKYVSALDNIFKGV